MDDADAIARTHVASWKATYPGIVPELYLDSLNIQAFAAQWRSRLPAASGMMTYVAEGDGMICGFASGGPARTEIAGFSGELYAIYLYPEAQGRGIGSRLFWAVVRELQASGHRSMYIWVLKENPARGFYERMGGASLTTSEIEIGGKTLTEIAYAWQELTAAGMSPE